jgi:hypothetical protein
MNGNPVTYGNYGADLAVFDARIIVFNLARII